MPKINNKMRFIPSTLLIFFLTFTGCIPAQTRPPNPTAEDALPTQVMATQTAIEEATLAPSPSPTPEPPEIFLSESLPAGLRSLDIPNGISSSEEVEASLWFGPESESPEGERLHTATWVYALAAPFPTLTDSVSFGELRAYWRGYHPGSFKAVTNIYFPEGMAAEFHRQWGPPAGSNIILYSSAPEIDALWEQNAWVVLPFGELHPKLKVIQINGISPLQKDFTGNAYPLTLDYVLIQRREASHKISEGDLQALITALPETNRNPDKMTTLVMTGVTALVRATADRMETKGVRYPGEKIRPWLIEADLTHISNEVSFYENCPDPDPNSRSLFFCSDPKYIELFEYIGADIIELTGNHNNDILHREGKYLVPYNIKLYKERGMAYYGGGTDIEDARSPLTLTHNGNQLAFIGCNAPGPKFAWANEYQGGAAPCGDYQWMVDAIQKLKADVYLPIATFQYYEDYYNFAESHHLRDFGRIADAGAVIVNGSQAHRPKSMAFMGETLVDFGLGNLFFDQMGYTDMYGNNLQQVRWEKIQRHTFYDGRHLSTEILTAILEDYAQPRPMTAVERQVFLVEIFSASKWNPR